MGEVTDPNRLERGEALRESVGPPGKGGALGHYRRSWHQGRASGGDSFL